MKAGDTASIRRCYTPEDIAAFQALTGAPDTAIASIPEPLVAALFSYLLGVKVPGPGTNYLKQELVFHHGVPVGEEVSARVTITRLRPEKHLCDLETVLADADGRILVSGRALVLTRDAAGA